MNRKQRRAQTRPGEPGSRARAAASPQVAGWLRTALAHQHAGRAAEAERVCHLILSIDPGHAPTLHLLGLVEHQQGRSDDAIEHIREAIARDGRDAAFHHNLGNILLARDRAAEAVKCYERALALAPDSVDTLYNLGNALQQLGQPESRDTLFRASAAPQAGGNRALQQSRLPRCTMSDGSTRRSPVIAKGWRWRRTAWRSSTISRARCGSKVSSTRRKLVASAPSRSNPIASKVTSGSAEVSRARGQREEAASYYQRALALAPDHPAVINNFGVLLVELGRPAEAIALYQRVLATQPDRAETHNNLGIALEYQGRHTEALACYERALALKPDYADRASSTALTPY